MRAFVVVVALCLVASPFFTGPVRGQQPLFAGKTVTIIVGYNPGGGYDLVARLVARYLPKDLPGNPTIVVQHMPGAKSGSAANHVYAVAKPDGLALGAFNRNLVLGQLVKAPGIRFDMAKFAWIGSPASETTVLTIRNDLPYRTPADLTRADPAVIVGATGPGASTYDFPLLLKALAKLNLRIISGYPSSADIMLAVERKEVDGRAGSYTSLRPFIDRGLVRPVVRARATEPGIEKLPVDEDLATAPRAKAIMALRSGPEIVGRPYVMPPGTPDALVKIVREAFVRVARDPELVDEATRAKMEIEYVSDVEALKIIREVLGQPRDVVDEFSKYIKFGD